VTRSVTTVTTGVAGASRSRAATAAAPVSGCSDTMTAGRLRATAAATGRLASASSDIRSKRMAGRELVMCQTAPHSQGTSRTAGP
jgi:hypothetical protein